MIIKVGGIFASLINNSIVHLWRPRPGNIFINNDHANLELVNLVVRCADNGLHDLKAMSAAHVSRSHGRE